MKQPNVWVRVWPLGLFFWTPLVLLVLSEIVFWGLKNGSYAHEVFAEKAFQHA